MITRYILFWLPMILIAFANAGLRELVFIKQFGEFRAHQYSTLTLMLFCAVYTWLVFPHLGIKQGGQALLVGFLWMALTVVFEFSMGRLTNKSWEYLLQNYNLLEGKLWTVFLLWLLVLPFLVYLVRNR